MPVAVVQAAVPPGRFLAADPVLGAGRAIWAEGDERQITLVGLAADGRRTVLGRLTDAPGLRSDEAPGFEVPALAAADRRIALVRRVRPVFSGSCTQGPCKAPPPAAPVSTSLLAGTWGHVRPVVVRSAGCNDTNVPAGVAEADSGLVVLEGSPAMCPVNGPSRVVLRSFDGRLRRVLRPRVAGDVDRVVAAGRWAGWVERRGATSTVMVVDARTGGRIVRRPLHTTDRVSVALGGGGTVAVATSHLRSDPCDARNGQPTATLRVGAIARPALRAVEPPALGFSFAAAAGRVAYTAADGTCSPARRVVVVVPGRPATTLAGLEGSFVTAFDGRVLAAVSGNVVRRAALRG